jgi:hypothetical protein
MPPVKIKRYQTVRAEKPHVTAAVPRRHAARTPFNRPIFGDVRDSAQSITEVRKEVPVIGLFRLSIRHRS